MIRTLTDNEFFLLTPMMNRLDQGQGSMEFRLADIKRLAVHFKSQTTNIPKYLASLKQKGVLKRNLHKFKDKWGRSRSIYLYSLEKDSTAVRTIQAAYHRRGDFTYTNTDYFRETRQEFAHLYRSFIATLFGAYDPKAYNFYGDELAPLIQTTSIYVTFLEEPDHVNLVLAQIHRSLGILKGIQRLGLDLGDVMLLAVLKINSALSYDRNETLVAKDIRGLEHLMLKVKDAWKVGVEDQFAWHETLFKKYIPKDKFKQEFLAFEGNRVDKKLIKELEASSRTG